MINRLFVILCCKLFLLLATMTAPNADEIRDFGIRVGAGMLQGVGDEPLREVSVYADMYLLSQQTRMLFGFSLYDTSEVDIPSMSIQSIGLEQNMRLLQGEVFVGVVYNKSYLKTEGSRYDPRRGESFHLGYKYPVVKYEDIVLTIGQQYRPLNAASPNASTKLSSKTEYLRLAYQWYF